MLLGLWMKSKPWLLIILQHKAIITQNDIREFVIDSSSWMGMSARTFMQIS